jgi:hypothetical protein
MQRVALAVRIVLVALLPALLHARPARAECNDHRENVCTRWCTMSFRPGPSRSRCPSDADRHRGPCFDCGPAGDAVGLCGSVCCADGEVRAANACATPTPSPSPTPTSTALPSATATIALAYETSVTGRFDTVVEYNTTVLAPAASAAVQSAFGSARQAVVSACAASCTQTCTVGSPALISSTQSNGTFFAAYEIVGLCK